MDDVGKPVQMRTVRIEDGVECLWRMEAGVPFIYLPVGIAVTKTTFDDFSALTPARKIAERILLRPVSPSNGAF